jgi:hypothetical protein
MSSNRPEEDWDLPETPEARAQRLLKFEERCERERIAYTLAASNPIRIALDGVPICIHCEEEIVNGVHGDRCLWKRAQRVCRNEDSE